MLYFVCYISKYIVYLPPSSSRRCQRCRSSRSSDRRRATAPPRATAQPRGLGCADRRRSRQQLSRRSSSQTGWCWLNAGRGAQRRQQIATLAVTPHRKLRTQFVSGMFHLLCHIPSYISIVYTIFVWLYIYILQYKKCYII